MAFGWTGSDDKEKRHLLIPELDSEGQGLSQIRLSMITQTCAGCHTQRVRLSDGSLKYLDGGPNNELRFHEFKTEINNFFSHWFPDRVGH